MALVGLWHLPGVAFKKTRVITSMDKLTPEQRHKNMVAVKGKGTKIEVLFGRALWHAGLRFRKNNKTIFGHPDFSHKGKKIAIFCDGENVARKRLGKAERRV